MAHPDDETFGTGGTLAYYSRQGVDVHLVCATRGEVGDVDERYLKGFNSISERREFELRCAAEKLGLKAVYFMGYRDSGMPGSTDNLHPLALAAQPMEKVASEVAYYFRLLRPQVVITFDPIGGYRHPDHIAIHNATVKAFENGSIAPIDDGLTPYQPQKLYFQTMPRGLFRVAVFVLKLTGQDPRHFGRNHDIDVEALAKVSFPIHARINYKSIARIRDEAGACHASQGGQEMRRGLRGWLGRLSPSTETYMRAYPPPVKGHTEKDLFEGII